MKFTKFILASIALASAMSVSAAGLIIATGNEKGTYSKLIPQVNDACSSTALLTERRTSGSNENIDLILNNEVDLAIVQTDSLHYKRMMDDPIKINNIKMLRSLHLEELHIITLVTSPIKSGGTLGFNSKPISVNTLADLTNQAVAVWGGGIHTAEIVKAKTSVKFKTVIVDNFSAANKKLINGEVAAIFMLGGSPMQDVKTLTNGYKLVSISDQHQSALKSIYEPTKLHYSNLGVQVSGVNSIAVRALLVSRAVTSLEHKTPLLALKTCMDTNLVSIRDKRGNHPAWRSVTNISSGNWESINLSNTAK